MAVYLDCNATTPVDPRVREAILRYIEVDFGNAGSRTHEFGTEAKRAVNQARTQLAAALAAGPDEVLFTSGATESNNLAILGLAAFGERTKRRHIVSTQIEHKAVLEPLEALGRRGFEVTLLPPSAGGWVDPEAIAASVRDDTLLVSVMHVNNETGVVQPLRAIADVLRTRDVYFHVDAAQGFGKEINELSEHVDLISLSGHKIHASKGIGALVVRRRGYTRPPLEPLQFGGGQERGLRPGTLAVHSIVGLGMAAELALNELPQRRAQCLSFREEALKALGPLNPTVNGDPQQTLPHVLNVSFPRLDSEAVMVALKDLVAVSNGAACTSQSYESSHVLTAMGLTEERVRGALRLSWCYLTETPNWTEVVRRISRLHK